MTKEEIEESIAKNDPLVVRPGPNDLSVRYVSIARIVGERAETHPRPSESIPIGDLVRCEDGYAATGLERSTGNYKEAEALSDAITEMVGSDPGDGYGTVRIGLTLGQLRRLSVMLDQRSDVRVASGRRPPGAGRR